MVTESLGQPVIFDAALVSYAHRLRAFWSSFLMQHMIPRGVLRGDLRLADVLHADHIPREALYSDAPPFACFNVRGQRMEKYVTAVRFWDTHSIRDGSGLVEMRESRGVFVRMRVEELEVVLGFAEGDTAAPEIMALPRFASECIRWGVLGNCIDANALTFVFSHLPDLPVF